MGWLLVTALGVMLLMAAGASFALAIGAVGVMTRGRHGPRNGLASFIRNPAAATGSYLANVTAGQPVWDLFDFALTFVPGSVFGAGGHTIARTTARDMAATRTALRGGSRQAAQTTERTAARGEAQHIAEPETPAAGRGVPPKRGGSGGKSGSKPRPGDPFPDVQSMRGRPAEEILDVIPDDWIADTPRKEPGGIRFRNPHRNGEQVIYEPGKPWSKDPMHAWPYLRVSEGGRTYRIPLEGSLALWTRR